MKYLFIVLWVISCGGKEFNESLLSKSTVTKGGVLSDEEMEYKTANWWQLLETYYQNRDLNELMIGSIDYLDIVDRSYINGMTFLQFLLQELMAGFDDFKWALFTQMIRDSRLIAVDDVTKYDFFLQLNQLLGDYSKNRLAIDLIDELMKDLKFDGLSEPDRGNRNWMKEFAELVISAKTLKEEEMLGFINSIQLLYLEFVKKEVMVDPNLYQTILTRELERSKKLVGIPNAIDILCWNHLQFRSVYVELYRSLTAQGLSPSPKFEMVLSNGLRWSFSCGEQLRENRERRRINRTNR